MRRFFATLIAAAVLVSAGVFTKPAKAQEPNDRLAPVTQWYQPYGVKKRVKVEQTHQRAIRHVRKGIERMTAVAAQTLQSGRLATVDTAADIKITVSREHAAKFQGFIADLAAQGYKPPRLKCFATGNHVSRSLHYRGEACDFNQRGWGLTDRPMYHVAALARKWGLRDGCSFRDCGHIDTGHGMRAEPHPFLGSKFAAVSR